MKVKGFGSIKVMYEEEKNIFYTIVTAAPSTRDNRYSTSAGTDISLKFHFSTETFFQSNNNKSSHVTTS